MALKDLFGEKKPIIGMVHLLPLPGTPLYKDSLADLYNQAIWEAQVLQETGVDGLIVENFGDEPFMIGEPEPIQFAVMAAALRDVRRCVSIPVGLNVQFNAWKAEMAIAYACNADFIRVEVFVDTVVMAQGLVHPCSAALMRYRKSLGANIQIWADIQTKYTTNLVSQSLTQSAIDARNAGADALIVTGSATGQATPLDSVTKVKEVVNIPVLVGSGTTITNVKEAIQIADGAIVGSSLKEGGSAWNRVSPEKSREFMNVARGIG
jgi:membrane complex biogenesis BtpA family protein